MPHYTDAVLGRIDLDEEDKLLPAALHRRGELEDAYERLLTELSWLLDLSNTIRGLTTPRSPARALA